MSQRSYGFLIKEELIFRLPNFEFLDHFSASLSNVKFCKFFSFEK